MLRCDQKILMVSPMRIQEVQRGVKRIQLEMPLLKRLKLDCNVYAFQTKSGTSLFDCGPEEAVAILQSILGTGQINQVFLTHGHADHAGSGGYWLKRGVTVFASEDDCAILRSGGPKTAPKAFRYPGFEPTGTISLGDRIALDGEFDFVVIPTRGHTPGSVCYYDEHKDILISGDLLFGPLCGHMVTFLAEFLTAQRQSRVDLQSQIESLENLVNNGVIKSTTLILPGHGPEYYLREKPSAIKRSLRLLRLCLRL